MLGDDLDWFVADRVCAVVFDDRAKEAAVAARLHVGDGGFEKRHPTFCRDESRLDFPFDLLFDLEGELPVSSARASFNTDSEIGAPYLVA